MKPRAKLYLEVPKSVDRPKSKKNPNFSLFPFERKSQLFTQLSSARTRNRWFFIDFCLFCGLKGKFFVWHKTLLSFYWKLTWTSFDGSFYLLFDLHRVPKKTSNSFLLAESCELIEGSTAFLALNISVFLRVCAFLTPFIRCVRVFYKNRLYSFWLCIRCDARNSCRQLAIVYDGDSFLSCQ